jgi:hypothetical protein
MGSEELKIDLKLIYKNEIISHDTMWGEVFQIPSKSHYIKTNIVA